MPRADSRRQRRLIPALAGKTPRPAARPSRLRAHPRAGGENCLKKRQIGRASGSSPRWRGKHRLVGATSLRDGLIPALAGKTVPAAGVDAPSAAHPRAGGDNVHQHTRSRPQRGSSPRWRGKLDHEPFVAAALRLIPALAGKTPRSDQDQSPRKAHPRAGGENVTRGM